MILSRLVKWKELFEGEAKSGSHNALAASTDGKPILTQTDGRGVVAHKSQFLNSRFKGTDI